MTISLTGIQQFRVMDFLNGWRPGTRVEMKVARGLIEKIFPEHVRTPCQSTGNPTLYNAVKLIQLPLVSVDLADADAEALKSALEAAIANKTVAVVDFDWLDALLEAITEKD